MYGIQTSCIFLCIRHRFENDVKMYGIQTLIRLIGIDMSLRMM